MCSSKRMIYLINGWDNISGIENQATISKHSVWIMFCENFKIFLLYYQYFSLIRFMANISITFSRCETESNNKRIPSRVRLKIRSEAKGSYRKYNIDVYRVLVCQIVLLTFSLYITWTLFITATWDMQIQTAWENCIPNKVEKYMQTISVLVFRRLANIPCIV